MAIENVISELSWICALLFLIVAVILLLTCVCFKNQEKTNHEYGTAGRLSITRDSPILQLQPRNCITLSISSKNSDYSDDGNLKRNSWTVKDRALPEIPDSTVRASNNCVHDNSLALSTIGDTITTHTRSKRVAPKSPGCDTAKVFPLNDTALVASDGASGVTLTITVNDKTQIIGNTRDLDAKPRLSVIESIPGSSSNIILLKKVEKKDDPEIVLSDVNSNLYDTVAKDASDRCQSSLSSSPVSIKIENPGVSSALEEENLNSPSASLAVSGAVPSSDIPYMTPPLLQNPSSTSADLVEENVALGGSGGRSEVPYTVISVREPLARVREITIRKQRAAAIQQQQNSEDSEDHYAMVPDEEQMYAEIGSGHDSGSSSITYAHIEPRELPPVPPTVESLKSVAHAHSRQASTVSISSFTSNNSSSEESTSPALCNLSAFQYSSVDKSGKQRKTIHVSEGVSILANNEKRKKVEDLYAKVHKKRVDLTVNTSESDDYSYQGIHGENLTPPPSPWASLTPPAPPPITGRLQAASLNVLLPGCSHHIRRHSADPSLPDVISENRVFGGSNSVRSSLVETSIEEPNYEKIYNEDNNSGNSCYEKIKDESIANGQESKSSYHPELLQGESNYAGYESVKDEDEDGADPGYECVAQMDSEIDPCYEPVKAAGSFDDSDSNSEYTGIAGRMKDPGYEKVKRPARSGRDASDPGYEKIKKVPRTASDATDPGYEQVRNKSIDPGYETVNRSDSDTDPCYEVVHTSNLTDNECCSKRLSTNSVVLNSPGNSDDISYSVSSKTEKNATFL